MVIDEATLSTSSQHAPATGHGALAGSQNGADEQDPDKTTARNVRALVNVLPRTNASPLQLSAQLTADNAAKLYGMGGAEHKAVQGAWATVEVINKAGLTLVA